MYLGSTVQDKDHKDLTATVQVLELSTLSTAGVEEKDLYRLETEGNPGQWKESG